VRTYLAMARQQQPERGPVAINDVIWAALDITGYTVRSSNIEVALDLGKKIPPILADADQLHQVVMNLIVNAQQVLQDQPGKRRIRVGSRFDAAAGAIRINVADNGPGIPEHLRARVFEPFFTTKPVGFGTGIGLAVSFGIVEAHGGTLAVECPASGGTVFSMTLPAVTVDAADADVSRPALKAAKPLAVLVVDDEAAVRDMLSEILRDAGHSVVTAVSGRDALARLGVAHYDVILTDIRMPELDGRDLYREIAVRWPERAPRVVFLTGDTLSATSRNIADESGCPVMEKPFLPSEVRRVVAEVALRADVSAPR
jgi:two-component system NtrC family sensor kinase